MILLRLCCALLLSVTVSVFASEPLTDYPPKYTPEAKIYRGSIVYQHYCVLCHGVNAEGNGRAAKLHNPPPYNLRRSLLSDAYKEQIIRKGGKAVGRAEGMPPWGEELTDEQIKDVVAFLRSIVLPESTNPESTK